MEREHVFMSDEVWDTILNHYIVPYHQINSFCPPTAILHKDGETLLNKKLPDRMRSIADVLPDMKIDIYSNGLMLPILAAQGRDFFKFVTTLPSRVRYLMSYHPFNYDNSPNDYSEVIPYLRDVLCNPPSNVEFITVSHKSKWVSDNIQDAWRQCWEGLPITVHKNCSINPWTGRMEDIATCKYDGCPYADFGHWFIGVTGNIIACCLDLEEEIVLGNVLKDDPHEMFLKTQAFYAEQRAIHAQKRKVTHQVCANCFNQQRTDLIQIGVA